MSNALGQLQRGLPTEIREHALARLNDLEWVFEKPTNDAAGAQLAARLLILVDGIDKLGVDWPATAEAASERLLALLNPPGSVPAEIVVEDVLACHPPAVELSAASDGLAFVRWLLHRIFPYPTFLLDEVHVAARVGVKLNSLVEIEEVQPARYDGIFAGFDGPRWWKAGVDKLIFDATQGRPFDTRAVHEALTQLAGAPLDRAAPGAIVATVDADYRPSGLASVDDVVQLELDDWPPYAQQPWATIDDARENAGLLARVIPAHRSRFAT